MMKDHKKTAKKYDPWSIGLSPQTTKTWIVALMPAFLLFIYCCVYFAVKVLPGMWRVFIKTAPLQLFAVMCGVLVWTVAVPMIQTYLDDRREHHEENNEQMEGSSG